MALKLPTKAAPQPTAQPAAPAPVVHSSISVQQPKAAPASGAWFKRGNATAEALKHEDKRIEEKFSGLWRFYLDDPSSDKPNKVTSTKITFLDGFLTPEGILDCFMFRDHRVFYHGSWEHFICTSEQEPCPICESGDEPSLVGVFTIIDHRVVKGKKGTYKDRQMLFAAKRHTLRQLQALATPRGGIAGWTVQVSRVGEKSAGVGDTFDFLEHHTEDQLRKMYVKTDPKTKKTETVAKVADYQKEIKYFTAAELRKMSFGKGGPIGSETGPKDDSTPAGANVASQL